jgi:hypothetical protein
VDGAEQDSGWPTFWAALEVLTSTGQAEFVAHVVEGDSALAEILHPLAIDNGEEGERVITYAGEQAVGRDLAGREAPQQRPSRRRAAAAIPGKDLPERGLGRPKSERRRADEDTAGSG